MKIRKLLPLCVVFVLSLVLTISCNPTTDPDVTDSQGSLGTGASAKIVMGYSNWPGWWPWAIAKEAGLFAENGVNVELKWFDGYLESMQALAAGRLDANCQT
ncbi:MAG: ABC transporter substrate-binding protein, partial [Symploca sp. SIO1B1]|nr:ABC transporter substrate-binding protein [Symploca sp. SIO1B1]